MEEKIDPDKLKNPPNNLWDEKYFDPSVLNNMHFL